MVALLRGQVSLLQLQLRAAPEQQQQQGQEQEWEEGAAYFHPRLQHQHQHQHQHQGQGQGRAEGASPLHEHPAQQLVSVRLELEQRDAEVFTLHERISGIVAGAAHGQGSILLVPAQGETPPCQRH